MCLGQVLVSREFFSSGCSARDCRQNVWTNSSRYSVPNMILFSNVLIYLWCKLCFFFPLFNQKFRSDRYKPCGRWIREGVYFLIAGKNRRKNGNIYETKISVKIDFVFVIPEAAVKTYKLQGAIFTEFLISRWDLVRIKFW